MRLVEIDVHIEATDQVFSYYYEDTMLHFNTSMLARIHKQLPDEFRLFEMNVTDAEYSLCMQHRGIEEPKVAALKGKNLREPGYGVLFDKWLTNKVPTFTIVDGHHRLVRRYRGGIRTMSYWICFPYIWRNCLMPGSAEIDAIIAKALPPKVENEPSIFSQVRMRE